MKRGNKQPWNHTQQCAACASQKIPPDVTYENGASGCHHYRGGKSAKDNGKSWPKLARGRPVAAMISKALIMVTPAT